VTELPYWVESWNPEGESRVWVRVPSIPPGESTIYLYYGNPGAISAESGDATFRMIDGITTRQCLENIK
jgi:hypothetical protein